MDIQLLGKMKWLSRSVVPSWHRPYHGNTCATKHREYNEVEGTHDAAAAVVRVASLIEGSTQCIKQGTYEGEGGTALVWQSKKT
jgi:hypothetical protein